MKFRLNINPEEMDRFLMREEPKTRYPNSRIMIDPALEQKEFALGIEIDKEQVKVVSYAHVLKELETNLLFQPEEVISNTITINIQGVNKFKSALHSLFNGAQVHYAGYSDEKNTIYFHQDVIEDPDMVYRKMFEKLPKSVVWNFLNSHEIGHALSKLIDTPEYGFFSHDKKGEELQKIFSPWKNKTTNEGTVILENYADMYAGLVLTTIYPEHAPEILLVLAESRIFQDDKNYQTQQNLIKLADYIKAHGQFKSFEEFNQFATHAIHEKMLDICLKNRESLEPVTKTEVIKDINMLIKEANFKAEMNGEYQEDTPSITKVLPAKVKEIQNWLEEYHPRLKVENRIEKMRESFTTPLSSHKKQI